MNTAIESEDVLVQEITIDASAERIFRALTDPAELLRWWAVEGKFRTLVADCDVRPGGAWWMQVEGNCAGGAPIHTVRGIYLVVDPPHRLEYTWKREGEEFPESTVRWDLEERNGQTMARVTHSGLISEAMKQRNNGWSQVVHLLRDWLEERA